MNNMFFCPECHHSDVQYLWNEEQSQCHSDGGMSVCEDKQKGPVRMKIGIGKPEDGLNRTNGSSSVTHRYIQNE